MLLDLRGEGGAKAIIAEQVQAAIEALLQTLRIVNWWLMYCANLSGRRRLPM